MVFNGTAYTSTWFEKYLSHRKQCVKLNGFVSSLLEIIMEITRILSLVPYCLCYLSMTMVYMLKLRLDARSLLQTEPKKIKFCVYRLRNKLFRLIRFFCKIIQVIIAEIQKKILSILIYQMCCKDANILMIYRCIYEKLYSTNVCVRFITS